MQPTNIAKTLIVRLRYSKRLENGTKQAKSGPSDAHTSQTMRDSTKKSAKRMRNDSDSIRPPHKASPARPTLHTSRPEPTGEGYRINPASLNLAKNEGL